MAGIEQPGTRKPTFNSSIILNGRNIELAGDTATPGNSKYFGTNALGVKGYYDLQTLGLSGTTTNVGNAYALALTGTFVANPPVIDVKINATNTGAATINVNGIGNVSIVKNGNVPVIAGDLVAGSKYTFSYDGTNYQVIGGLNGGAISGVAGGDLAGTYPNPSVQKVGGGTANQTTPYQVRTDVDNLHFTKQERFLGTGAVTVFTLKKNIFKYISVHVNGLILDPNVDYYFFGKTVNFVVAPILNAVIVIVYDFLNSALASEFSYNKGIVSPAGTAYMSIPNLAPYTVAPEWTFEFMFKPDASIATFDGVFANKNTGGGGYTNGLFYIGYAIDGAIFFLRFVFYSAGGAIVANIPSEQYFLATGSEVQNILFGIRFRRQSASSWIFEIFENGLLYRTANVASNPFTTWPSGFNFFTDGGTPAANTFFDARFTERALSDEEMFLNTRSGTGNYPQEDTLFWLKFDDVFASGGANYTTDSSGNNNNGQFINWATPANNLVNYSLATTTERVVFTGNSIVFGTGATTTMSNEFYRAMNDGKIFIKNIGVPGQTTPQMIANDPARIDRTHDLSRAKNIVVFFEIGNDVNGGATAAAAYANVVTWCQARKAANPTVKIILCTCTRRVEGISGTIVGFNATIGTVNASILTDFNVATADPYTWLPGVGITYADVVANVYARPNLVNPAGPYYNVDGTHLSNSGQVEMATGIKNAKNLLP